MYFWTTFTPQKICWELTTVSSKSKAGDGRWMNHLPLIDSALRQLREAGISGIRLVIYPEEITIDGKTFHWEPVEKILDLAKKNKLAIDFCIGPYQYPNYPGVYLPPALMGNVLQDKNSLDSCTVLREFGNAFLRTQLTRYGKDRRIHGFHFANEWPDRQNLKGKESFRVWISKEYMLQAAKYIKDHTHKPISMNTNIDASDKWKIAAVFGDILRALGEQGRLGFDIYPSQETWRKAFLQKLRRFIEPYDSSFQWSCKRFAACEIYFCEVEAQPWGSGQSWYRMISDEQMKEKQILNYANHSLSDTFASYVLPSEPQSVSLWGSDFWLAASAMGVTWPLDQIKELTQTARSR